MTDQDKPAFLQSVARLAVALREKEPDIALMRVYFEALKPLEIDFVVASALQLETSAQWFPKTSEWYAAALRLEADRREEQRAILRKLPGRLCAACEDTGWARTAEGVRPCTCRTLRRLEVLGRRPMPTLPELQVGDETQLPRAEALARQHVRAM